MVDNWYLIAAAGLGIVGAAAAYFSFGSPKQSKGQRLLGFLVAGPFAPAISGYLERRGGLKSREVLGLLILVGLFVAAVVFALATGIGRRGG